MKKLRLIAFATAIFLSAGLFAACQAPEAETPTTVTPIVYSFDALVLEISENGVRLCPLSGEAEIQAGGDQGIMLATQLRDGSSIPELEKGMLIRVSYNGIITNSLPAQINGVIGVEILEEAA